MTGISLQLSSPLHEQAAWDGVILGTATIDVEWNWLLRCPFQPLAHSSAMHAGQSLADVLWDRPLRHPTLDHACF